MKPVLEKEFRLALHPTSLLFLGLSAMLLIPNYPYYVIFFYTCLGIFFICLTGRENQDLLYMMLLPIRKRDIVRGRIALAAILQLAQMLLAIPFAILRQKMSLPGNQVGMDANTALFGVSFLLLGLFNFFFFTRYYQDPKQVGKPFAVGSTVLFVCMGIAEALTHIVPFFRDCLDTPDPQHMGAKLAVLAVGAALYAALTVLGCRISEQSFEKLDL